MTDTERFGLSLEIAEELPKLGFTASGFEIGSDVRIEESGDPNPRLERPSEDKFAAAVQNVRKFVSDNEPVFVDQIVNLLKKHLLRLAREGGETGRQARELLGELHLHLKIQRGVDRFAPKVRVVVDGRVLTTAAAADFCFNALYAHADPGKRESLRRLLDSDRVRLKDLFFRFVTSKIVYVLQVKALIERARALAYLNDQSEFQKIRDKAACPAHAILTRRLERERRKQCRTVTTSPLT